MKRHMKKKRPFAGIIFLTMLLLLLSGCHVLEIDDEVRNTNYSANQSFYFEVLVDQQKQVRLAGISGPVHIVGDPATPVVQIRGERRVESESFRDADAHLEDLEVHITDRDEEIFIETIQPRDANGRNYLVAYNVVMPMDWDAVIGLVNGEVHVDSLEGDLAIGLTNGDIFFNEIYGDVNIELINGQIDGSMALPLFGKCKISVVNGQIQLDVPASTSADFSASVTNGNVTLTGLTLSDATSTRNLIRGRLGQGEGEINLTVVNGRIDVRGLMSF